MNKKWLCWIGLHKWQSFVDKFEFGQRWRHSQCARCGKVDSK